MKDVKKGMKEFTYSYTKNLEDTDGNSTPEPEQRKERKLLDAVIKYRQQARLLGILDSHEETELSSIVQTERRETERRPGKHATSLSWIGGTNYVPLQEVKNTLLFWIEMSPDLNNPFPGLALDIYSIPTMSAEGEHVFSKTKRVITDNRN